MHAPSCALLPFALTDVAGAARVQCGGGCPRCYCALFVLDSETKTFPSFGFSPGLSPSASALGPFSLLLPSPPPSSSPYFVLNTFQFSPAFHLVFFEFRYTQIFNNRVYIFFPGAFPPPPLRSFSVSVSSLLFFAFLPFPRLFHRHRCLSRPWI